jgi:hypothetical protein
MALWFPLKVNDKVISYVEIVRRSSQTNPSKYVYDWTVNTNPGNTTKCASNIVSGTVVHDYAEGAFVLLEKVIGNYNSL